MKLKELKNFNIHSNRFVLFDKTGRELNWAAIEKLPNYLDLEVIETKDSGFQSYVYFVGFATLHIKLNILNDNLVCPFHPLKFGEVEIEGKR